MVADSGSINKPPIGSHGCAPEFGARAFASAASKIWNSLPLDLRRSPSIEPFRSNLKPTISHQFKDVLLPPGDRPYL
jgi:hypothetical protein